MRETAGMIVLVVAGTLTYTVWRSVQAQRMARRRLELATDEAPEAGPAPPVARPFVRRYRWVPILMGLAAGFTLYFFLHWTALFAAALGLALALVGWLLEESRAQGRVHVIEAQLADALDLMVGALGAGVSVTQAFEAAALETRAPLQPQLEYVLNRIRLGDDAQAVLRTLEQSVPLPTFRLFAAALSVHWEVGGSLSGPLAVVGRAVRDRIEMSRRVRSLTAQARFSTMAVLGTTYFIAVVMWRTDPDRMRDFLGTTLGEGFVAAAIVLQIAGIFWTARLSRIEF